MPMKTQRYYWDNTLRLFGKVLRHHRTNLKCSQQAMSKSLGCTRGHLAMLESGKRIPTAAMLSKLEKLTGHTLVELVVQAYA